VTIDLVAILKKNRVIPVAQFDDRQSALRTAELLQKHSIGILEITLRTESAMESIKSVAKQFPGLTVGAGSVLSLDAMKKAYDTGASFCVAPGIDPDLMDYAVAQGLAFIPGVSTPSELNLALKKCAVIKLFPISLLGGVEYIKAVSAPFMTKSFHLVPTGGVNQDNFLDYLRHERVISVGMSHIVDGALIRKEDYASIEQRIINVTSALQ
jgi:2-dehydro-3-deoxyphosphogluconate aldolase / (4S)-4-hydroxy-2-oxoglutarate aldolase